MITLYPNIRETVKGELITVNEFLTKAKTGFWKDIVAKVRTIDDKIERDKLKTKTLPYVAFGTFSKREIKGLIEHCGYIAIDFDDRNKKGEVINFANETEMLHAKTQLSGDAYVNAALVSCGGKGLFVLVKINGKKHLESFKGLQSYFFNQYGLIADVSCSDVSRARFVTDDPDLHYNTDSKLFKDYPKEEVTAKQRLDNFVYSSPDVESIIQVIEDKAIDITQNYPRWLAICFGFAEKYGDNGRDMFHRVSRFYSKYDKSIADKQFTYCLNEVNESKGVEKKKRSSMGTFFFCAKDAGIKIVSEQTQTIVSIAKMQKKAKVTVESAIENIVNFEGFDSAIVSEIVEQVFENAADSKADNELEPIRKIALYVKNNTNVKYNLITRQYEWFKDGKIIEMDKREFSSIYVSAKEIISDVYKSDLIDYIMSDRTPEYNPLIDFIELHKGDKINKSVDLIRELSDCIIAPDNKKIDKDFNYTFIKKWLVGMIASIYGNHTNLLLILCGTKQNTGKTEFFRRLLPKEINNNFYSECRFKEVNTKDDEIAMTCNLVMLWNELGGFHKKTNEDIKELCDKKAFYGRVPFGKIQTKMDDFSVEDGSSNKEELLSDPTGNRRIIPIYVGAINHEKYNSIDKTALFMQAYCLFMEGESYELKDSEIDYLNCNTKMSNITVTEEELLLTYFAVPTFITEFGKEIDFADMSNKMLFSWASEPKQKMFTNSQLLDYLQSRYSIKNLSSKILGSILSKCKFPKAQINRGGNTMQFYFLQELGDENNLTFE